MSDFTIMRNHPKWGHSPNCFDTKSNSVRSPDAVFQAWKPNRVLTPADTAEIEKRRNRAIKALKVYKASTGEAFEIWQELAKEYKEIEQQCEAGTRKFEAGITESQCILFETGKLSRTVGKGNLLLDELSRNRIAAFRECDFVMVNAPTAEIARDICSKKKDAFAENRKLIDRIGEFNKFMSSVRSRAFSQYDVILGGIITAIQGLVGLIQDLIKLIKDIVIAGVQLGTKLAGFFTRNPGAILAVGGVIALGVLAFIFRPYIALLGWFKT